MESPLIFKPDFNELFDHLKLISHERNFETAPCFLKEVQSYLKEKLLSYGLGVQEDGFSYSGETFFNLVARLPEEVRSPRLIVGAHFDSVPGSPGADDNASGVAALLECARLTAHFKKQNPSLSTKGTIEFVAFNLEEYGMIGSKAYVQRLKDQKVKVDGMISLEMVGYISQEKGSQKMPFFLKPFYPDVGNFIGLVANTQSIGFLKQVKSIFQSVDGLPVESLILPANGWIFPEARLSDHSPFWDEGFPALLVTDTSFFRNPYYHTEEDRIETVNLEFLARVTEATTRMVCKWSPAGMPAIP